MNFFRNFGIALDALLANKLRSGLTMLGIIIGVGSVVALLSIGNGVQQSINGQITSIGTNLVTVVPGQVRITAGPPTNQGIRAPTQTKPLTDADANAIRERVPNLLGVAPELTSNNVTVAFQREKILVTARGVTADYNRVRNLEVAQGRWFDGADDERASRVAILGSDAADALFGGLNPIGQTVRIGSAPFTVIGVIEPVGAGFAGNPDTSVFVPLQTAYRTISNARTASGARRVSVIYISALSSDDIPRVSAR
jgi:putative ABC transport system permease protein